MKFRKKPVIIDAIKYDGKNYADILEFIGQGSGHWQYKGNKIVIYTLEGNHDANVGDWIIKGVKGEFYPCKPDIFEMTYEPVSDSQNKHSSGEDRKIRNSIIFICWMGSC